MFDTGSLKKFGRNVVVLAAMVIALTVNVVCVSGTVMGSLVVTN